MSRLFHIHISVVSSPPSQHPVKTYGYAFFFSLTGYFGISFVLALIKLFGALVAVTGQSQTLLFSSLWDNLTCSRFGIVSRTDC